MKKKDFYIQFAFNFFDFEDLFGKCGFGALVHPIVAQQCLDIGAHIVVVLDFFPSLLGVKAASRCAFHVLGEILPREPNQSQILLPWIYTAKDKPIPVLGFGNMVDYEGIGGNTTVAICSGFGRRNNCLFLSYLMRHIPLFKASN